MELNDLVPSAALQGIKILEFSAIGPVPWGTSIMVELGATVTRVCRPNAANQKTNNFSDLNRTDVYIDLKSPEGIEQVKELISQHDVLVEGMRPGVMERLGLSPEVCHEINPKLVFARMTGWGQSGPLAKRAGHDINYISLTGTLHAIGPSQDGPPSIPLNLVGDYGGGGTFMIIGVLGALLKASNTGKGSVLDIAMIDGAAKQMALVYERLNAGIWQDERGSNMLDGGYPWYSVYETSCGGYMAVGSIEPQFYDLLLQGLGFESVPDRDNKENWNQIRSLFKQKFLSNTREHWTKVFNDSDACVTPVLSMQEAVQHPHNKARSTFVKAAENQFIPGIAPKIYDYNK